MVLSERQLRFIVRQELLTYLNEQETIDEGIFDKIKRFGHAAALGASLASAGAGVANVPDVNPKKEILNVLEEDVPTNEEVQSVNEKIKENFVFNKSGDGGYVVKFKNPKTGVVNENNVLKVPSEVVEQARELGKISDYKRRQHYMNHHQELRTFSMENIQAFIDGDAQLKQYQSELNVSVFLFCLATLLLVGTVTAELMSEPPKGAAFRPTSTIPTRRRY
jgi:hypothetical protein